MPVQPGSHGQMLAINPTQGDVGAAISVTILPPNPGQFEFRQISRVALFPDSQGLLASIQGNTFPSGFVSIRVPQVTVVSQTELRFEIPQAVRTYRQATGVDRFYVSVSTPPGWAWSMQPLLLGIVGVPIGFVSAPTLGGLVAGPIGIAAFPSSIPIAVPPTFSSGALGGLALPGATVPGPIAPPGTATPVGSPATTRGALPKPSRWTDGNLVETLVDGDAVYRSLWNDLQVAGEFIYLAFWRFTPDLVLDPATGTTIGQLLVQKANQGTTIKILVWDMLSNTAASIAAFFARLGIAVSVWPFPGLQLLALVKGQPIIDLAFAELTRTRQWHAGTPQPQIQLLIVSHPDQAMPTPQLHGFPAAVGSHHQKMVIMDQWAAPVDPPRPDPVGGGKNSPRLVAYILGLNVADDYWDDPTHRLNHSLRSGPPPWHDAGVRVEGPEASRAEQEFIRRWNLWRPASLWPSRIQNTFANTSRARFLVTQIGSPQIKGALTSLLARAQRSVYAEDQYFSNVELVDHLIEAYLASELAEVRAAQAQSRPVDLENFLQIALVTNSPEVFRNFAVEEPMEAFRYVNFTNLELCTCRSITLRNGTMIRRPFGADWRLQGTDWDIPDLEIPTAPNATALLQVVRVSGGVRPCYLLSSDPARPHIYVHSKLTIVDDQYALIGSANYAVRSMDYDSEADLEVDDHRIAQALRAELQTEHYGSFLSGTIGRQFFDWHQRADENASRLNVDPQAALLGNNVYIVRYPSTQPRFDLIAGLLFGAPGFFVTPYILGGIYPLH